MIIVAVVVNIIVYSKDLHVQYIYISCISGQVIILAS